MWWPNRAILNNMLKYMTSSHAENDMAVLMQEDSGVAAYANIGGYFGSSYRAEVAADIIAISAHGPIHIGSDSQAFVKKANGLIDSINKWEDYIIWGTQSDCDL